MKHILVCMCVQSIVNTDRCKYVGVTLVALLNAMCVSHVLSCSFYKHSQIIRFSMHVLKYTVFSVPSRCIMTFLSFYICRFLTCFCFES